MSNGSGEPSERVSGRRLALVTGSIAVVPTFLWWLVLQVTSDPDEGANIGGGLIGLGILVVSAIAAVGYLGARLARRGEETR